MRGSHIPFRAMRSLVEILACEDLEQRIWLTEAAFGFNEYIGAPGNGRIFSEVGVWQEYLDRHSNPVVVGFAVPEVCDPAGGSEKIRLRVFSHIFIRMNVLV